MRRSIAFSELLQHPNLVRMMGTWESDDTIFVGECHWVWETGKLKQLPSAQAGANLQLWFALWFVSSQWLQALGVVGLPHVHNLTFSINQANELQNVAIWLAAM